MRPPAYLVTMFRSWIQRHRGPALPAVIVGLALLLRVIHLGTQSFWLDEATSVMLARLDWTRAIHAEINAILYYRLLALWLRLGDSEAIIRGFSVLWSVLTVPVVYLLGCRLYGRREGITAALLLTVNAFHIAYAQEARGYSLAVFLVSVSSLFFVESVLHPSPTRWAGYALTSVLAVYTHSFAIFLPAAHAVSIMFLRPRDVPWRGLIAAFASTVLLIVPAMVLLIVRDAKDPDWIPRAGLRELYSLVQSLAGLAGPELLAVYLVACVAAAVAAGRAWVSEEASWKSWRQAFPLAWLLVPAAMASALSSYTPVLPRYLMICLPPLTLLSAAGFSQIRKPAAFACIMAITVALAARPVTVYLCCAQKEDWRGVSELVRSHAQDGDGIVFYSPYVRPAFEYYWTRALRYGRVPAVEVVSDAEAIPRSVRRVWLILSHDETVQHTASRALSAALRARFSPPRQWSHVGIEVALFSR